MDAPSNIKIGNVSYVRADLLPPDSDKEIKIVVLDRGFVYVGKVKIEGEFVIINKAQNIRVWGTKNGLGELVGGPTSATKLDNVGTVTAPLRALISIIDVECGKWKLI